MRKLSYLFMYCPRCAWQCRHSRKAGKLHCQLGRHHFRLRHGDCLRRLRNGASQSHRGRGEGLARNPAARPGIQLALILGLALIESLALYTLVIIFAKVK